jgi:hypothetical protein
MLITFAALAAGLLGMVYLLTDEIALPWKILAAGIALAAIAMQFVPALRVHFLIPFLMEITVAIWGMLYTIWPRGV